MKISLRWVFEHIDADYTSVSLEELVNRFNRKTAEIEAYYTINTDLKHIKLARITSRQKKNSLITIDDEKVELERRDDAYIDDWFLIKKDGKSYRWAHAVDIGGTKETLLPAFHFSEKEARSWKKNFEAADVIVEVDNKSITHRPDLWGHRGFAREIAALFDLKLKPLEQFLVHKKIEHYDKKSPVSKQSPFAIEIKTDNCNRFAGLYFSEIAWQPSALWMATRLVRVGTRAIDALVDCTNYVMYDLSQPMHAFDAQKLPKQSIIVRQAENKEKLTLLDDQGITLAQEDMVIADDRSPISLAGIMGGKGSGVTRKTDTLFAESASFNATTIRRSALRHKIRTEASARFEKDLDPNQNIDALLRFVYLLEKLEIPFHVQETIQSVGGLYPPVIIAVAHSFIENRLGISLASDFITYTLEKLGFTVKVDEEGDALIYQIEIPSYRATKDIHLKEDIVEEVGRMYGYDELPLNLPYVQTNPSNLQPINRVRDIKRYLAFGMHMHELEGYAFFDESFLERLRWQPGETVSVKNPISENYKHLITSLIPRLLQAVDENAMHHNQLRFFEWARVWQQDTQPVEKNNLAGVLYQKNSPVDFYDVKAMLDQLCVMMGLSVTWEKVSSHSPWYSAHQTAHIIHEDTIVGTAGILDTRFYSHLFEGSIFGFELDGQFLMQYKKPLEIMKAVPKYPAVERDISLFVPFSVTVAEVEKVIMEVDDTITAVSLQDIFEKDEWADKKAMTLHVRFQAEDHTMSSDEIDKIWQRVEKGVTQLGAHVR